MESFALIESCLRFFFTEFHFAIVSFAIFIASFKLNKTKWYWLTFDRRRPFKAHHEETITICQRCLLQIDCAKLRFRYLKRTTNQPVHCFTISFLCAHLCDVECLLRNQQCKTAILIQSVAHLRSKFENIFWDYFTCCLNRLSWNNERIWLWWIAISAKDMNSLNEVILFDSSWADHLYPLHPLTSLGLRLHFLPPRLAPHCCFHLQNFIVNRNPRKRFKAIPICIQIDPHSNDRLRLNIWISMAVKAFA